MMRRGDGVIHWNVRRESLGSRLEKKNTNEGGLGESMEGNDEVSRKEKGNG